MGLVRNLPPTAERANLNVDTIRSAFAIKSYGPQSIRDFNPEAFTTSELASSPQMEIALRSLARGGETSPP